MTRADERLGKCVSGMEFNLASFLPSRLTLSNMSVDVLAYLAAYSIRAAHDLDSAFVDGLDIAVYRDAVRRFEFLETKCLWDDAENFDGEIVNVLELRAQKFFKREIR